MTHYMPPLQNQISNAHLPHLSPSQLEQITALACSFSQEKPMRFSLATFFQNLVNSPARIFASTGIAAGSLACIALMMILIPAQHSAQYATQHSLAPQDMDYSENMISEYIIQDFLDEIV